MEALHADNTYSGLLSQRQLYKIWLDQFCYVICEIDTYQVVLFMTSHALCLYFNTWFRWLWPAADLSLEQSRAPPSGQGPAVERPSAPWLPSCVHQLEWTDMTPLFQSLYHLIGPGEVCRVFVSLHLVFSF